MAEELGERSEAPTGRKLGEARSRGQVAKSQDLSAAITLIASVILLAAMGGWIVTSLGALMRRLLEYDGSLTITLDGALAVSKLAAGETARVLVPLMLISAAVVALAHIGQAGWLFTFQPLQPKLERLDPIKGFGRLFGKRNAAKSLVGVVKVAVVCLVAWQFLRDRLDELSALPVLSLGAAFSTVGSLALELSILLLVVLLIIGVADFFYQRWQHIEDLKMTKQEVKDERRSMDGDPDVRARRMRLMREIASQRISTAVPEADVVVTNPTHFSVALRYDADTMAAPIVVAKGVDELALRIRHLARQHGVPLVERPPLARALYKSIEVGRPVPPEFYQAVAEVLAYVYGLEKRTKAA